MTGSEIKTLLEKHGFEIIRTTPQNGHLLAQKQTGKEYCSLVCTAFPGINAVISIAFNHRPNLRKAEKLMQTLFGDRFQRTPHEMDGKNAHYFVLETLN